MSGTPISSAPRGLTFGRYCKALAVAQGDPVGALAYASGQHWSNTPGVVQTLKAAVSPMDTQDEGAPLVTPVSFDLSEYLRPRTIIGRLQAVRRVPFNTRLLATAIGTSANWVGESAPIPVVKMDFDTGSTLDWAKLASIAVITRELARTSNPSAELAITNDVGRAIAEAADRAFISTDNSGVPNVKPASVTSAGDVFVSSGSSLANIDADLKRLIDYLTDNNVPLDQAVWLMPSRTATFLAMLRGSGGALAYPSMSDASRRLCGLPVLTSNGCLDESSPTEAAITLLAQDEIDLADDNAATLDYSEHASLQLSDTPTNGAAEVVSLWAHGLVGIRALRTINWSLRRSTACATLTQVQF